MRKLIVVLLVCFPLVSEAGGGWINEKYSWYLKFGQQWVNYNQYYNFDGILTEDRTRSLGETYIYAEYGMTNKLNAIVYLPFFSKATIFQQVNTANGQIVQDGESFSSIGDMNVSIKYGVLKEKLLVMSTTLTLGLPFGKTRKGTDQSLQTGDGEFNQMLSLDASSSFMLGKLKPYWSTYIGFNNRTEGFSDEVRYGIELGTSIRRWWFILKSRAIKSLRNGNAGDNLFFNGLLLNNSEYIMVVPEIAYEFSENWGLSINYTKVVTGKLIFAQPAYSFSIYLNLSRNDHT